MAVSPINALLHAWLTYLLDHYLLLFLTEDSKSQLDLFLTTQWRFAKSILGKKETILNCEGCEMVVLVYFSSESAQFFGRTLCRSHALDRPYVLEPLNIQRTKFNSERPDTRSNVFCSNTRVAFETSRRYELDNNY